MEAHSDDLPEANIIVVIQKLIQMTKSVRALFEAIDTRKTRFVGTEEAPDTSSSSSPRS
jgi:hypothetical protein